MAALLESELDADTTAISLARAVVIANRRAVEMGYGLDQHRLSIEEHQSPDGSYWRIVYLPNAGVTRRGGGCQIDVDASNGRILQALRCQ